MSDFQTNPTPLPSSIDSQYSDPFQAIQKTLQLTLMAILIIGGCFTVFVWRQQRELSRQVVQWQPYVDKYDKVLLPMIENVRSGLLNYARSNHPEIEPLLDKYALRQNPLSQTPASTPPASTPPVTTRPQTPLPPKK